MLFNCACPSFMFWGGARPTANFSKTKSLSRHFLSASGLQNIFKLPQAKSVQEQYCHILPRGKNMLVHS